MWNDRKVEHRKRRDLSDEAASDRRQSPKSTEVRDWATQGRPGGDARSRDLGRKPGRESIWRVTRGVESKATRREVGQKGRSARDIPMQHSKAAQAVSAVLEKNYTGGSSPRPEDRGLGGNIGME